MSKYNFFIPGKFPGMNEIIGEARKHKMASAKQKKAETLKVAYNIKNVSYPVKPCKLAWINFTWVERNKKRDPDNIVAAKKFILDGLVYAGLLKGDGWSHIAGFTDKWEVGEPGVWVEVREV